MYVNALSLKNWHKHTNFILTELKKKCLLFLQNIFKIIIFNYHMILYIYLSLTQKSKQMWNKNTFSNPLFTDKINKMSINYINKFHLFIDIINNSINFSI